MRGALAEGHHPHLWGRPACLDHQRS